MSSDTEQKSTEETLEELNNDTNNFISENKGKILCMMAYSVSFDMQPYVASYQRYFNHDLTAKYDAKTIYAYNLELPHFMNVYFILKKATEKPAAEEDKEICKELVNNFKGHNEHVLAGLSAFFYDIEKQEKVDEYHFGDKETLKEIQALQA